MMQQAIASALSALKSSDGAQQNAAYETLRAATRDRVDWAYEAWDEMVSLLRKGDKPQRAIAAQVLCSLAKSDPQERMLKDLTVVLETMKDERFVTARHCLQSLWKVGVAGDGQRKALVTGLKKRYKECAAEKNGTLIRYDILESLRKVYDAVGDESLRTTALSLIDTEPDAKYQKKYMTLWRKPAPDAKAVAI